MGPRGALGAGAARAAPRAPPPWAIAGFALLWSAAAEEAHLFGWTMAVPTPEGAIELAGAFLLAVYALEEAAAIHVARAASARRPRMPPAPAGRSREST